MGWLWSSSPPKSPTPPTTYQSSSSSSPSSSSISVPPSLSTSSHTPHNTSNEPAEAVDPEIQKLFDLFNKSESTVSTSATSEPKPSSTSSNFLSTWLASKSSSEPPPPPTPHLSPIAESLLPTDLSCRQAFDLAWSCNSLGGQFNAVYRQGEMRSCSHLWDDFWFCMRTKSYSGPLKERAMREHYRRKEYEKYYAPGKVSSEDVWEARTEKVELGKAFAEAIEIAAVDDEEWRKAEDERRKKIRQDLGFEKN